MPMYKTLSTSPAIPWRLRHGLERWLESSCRDRQPGLYRWFHFGEARDPLRAVTSGPGHHFFGYYDKSPWNASQRLLLAHEAPFNDRPPGAEDGVSVGVVHLADGNRYQPLSRTIAWNWQQGSMLQWHPADPEHLLLHNDRRGDRFVAIVRDTQGRELNVYERPMYAVSRDGRFAYSVNFARLYTHRPGYGYAGVADVWAADPHPREDGIHRLDLVSGRSERIISLDQLSHLDGDDRWHRAFQWINHVQVSPDGTRIAFFHIRREGETGWRARLCSCTSDGSEPTSVLDAEVVSHYDWLDNRRILIWSREQARTRRFTIV